MAWCVLPPQTKNWNTILFYLSLESQKKKSSDHIKDIKGELLDSIVNTDKTDETGLNDTVRNAKGPKEVVEKFEKLLKKRNKRIINIVVKQRELLKKIKESNHLSRSNVHFKIRILKFLSKYPALKNSMLPSNYFNSNFKSIKKVYLARTSRVFETNAPLCIIWDSFLHKLCWVFVLF